MDKNLLFITRGPSGVGKSLLVRNLWGFCDNLMVVCPDDLRRILFGDINDQQHNGTVWKVATEQIKWWLFKGFDVALSATSLYSIRELKERYGHFGGNYRIVIIDFIGYDEETLAERIESGVKSDPKLRSNTLVKPDDETTVLRHQINSHRELLEEMPKEDKSNIIYAQVRYDSVSLDILDIFGKSAMFQDWRKG